MHPHLSLDESISLIRQYNSSKYKPTNELNTSIDNRVLTIFKGGLDIDNLQCQIDCIVRDYAGVHRPVRNVFMQKAYPIISERIKRQIQEVNEKISCANPIDKGGPSEDVTRFLFGIFIVPIMNGSREICNHMTLASKFWHFVCPNVFPIKDRYSSLFLKSSGSSTEDYLLFVRRFCRYFNDMKPHMETLRGADSGNSWSDVKLLDKIAYQYGLNHDPNKKG